MFDVEGGNKKKSMQVFWGVRKRGWFEWRNQGCKSAEHWGWGTGTATSSNTSGWGKGKVHIYLAKKLKGG